MFDNIVALIGMPRSGTTILSRLIANHSRVEKIIEPYQARRDTNYAESDPRKLCRDFSVTERENTSLLVKETSSRSNIEHIRSLLNASHDCGYRSAYIFVLRSPLEAFLSQVDAAARLWARKPAFSRDKTSIIGFWGAFRHSMTHYFDFGLRFHGRVIVFDAFVRNPPQQIGRAMGLFGYPLEPKQLELNRSDPKFGGDPSARKAQAKLIDDRDHFRSDEVERLIGDFSSVPEFRAMSILHEYVKAVAQQPPTSREFFRDLFLLLNRGYIWDHQRNKI